MGSYRILVMLKSFVNMDGRTIATIIRSWVLPCQFDLKDEKECFIKYDVYIGDVVLKYKFGCSN